MMNPAATTGAIAAVNGYCGGDGGGMFGLNSGPVRSRCSYSGGRGGEKRRNPMLSSSGKRRGNVSSVALGDEYRILSVSPGASEDEVRKAYRRLALKYHPDCSGGNTANQFRQINEAYKMLVEAMRDERERGNHHTVYETTYNNAGDSDEEPFEWSRGSYYDDVEEWMGWEGAGIGFRNDESVYKEWP